jgi:hypothetical protein
MLTDGRTRPLHFGFATPVRPNALQRILYGNTLDEFVKIDVIAHKLLENLPRIPDILFVESPELVRVRRITRFAVAALLNSHSDAGESPNLSHVRFSVEESAEDNDQVASMVNSLSTSVNLTDPFGRVREALKEALKEASKKGKA